MYAQVRNFPRVPPEKKCNKGTGPGESRLVLTTKVSNEENTMSAVQNSRSKLPYYIDVRIQIGETGPEKTVKVDRKLKNAISDAVEPQRGGGGQVAVKELSRIVKNVIDGNRYGAGERALVQMLFQATDDRQHVYMNGKRIQITDPAEKAFVHAMFSFFGGLKGKGIKEMSGQTAVQIVQSFAQSQQGAAAQQAG